MTPGGTPRAVAVAAAVAVLVGLCAVGLGLLRATAWAPATSATSRVSAPTSAPVIVSDVPVLSQGGATVRIQARAASAGEPVFVGVARAGDVDAYLGAVARELVRSAPDGAARVSTVAGEASLPNPAGVDVWVALATGAGVATLDWPNPPGQWQFVVASDGAATAPAVELTWQLPARSSGAAALSSLGSLSVVVGSVGWVVLRRRRASPADADPHDVPDSADPTDSTDSTDRAEPTDPTDRAEPTHPTDRAKPTDLADATESDRPAEPDDPPELDDEPPVVRPFRAPAAGSRVRP